MCDNIQVHVGSDASVSGVVGQRSPWRSIAHTLVAIFAGLSCGCNGGPYGSQAQLTKIRTEHAAIAQQNNELRTRFAQLDQDNQQHSAILAQSQQQVRLREEQLSAVREQLGDVTQRLAQLQGEKQEADQQVESLLASSRRGGGASIVANNSLSGDLPKFNRADVVVRHNGAVVRIAIQVDSLFPSWHRTVDRQC